MHATIADGAIAPPPDDSLYRLTLPLTNGSGSSASETRSAFAA